MHLCAKHGIAIVYCPSVCLSVTFRYRDHIGWNSSKIFSRPNSLRPVLWLTPTLAIWCTFIRSITTTVINNFGKSSRGRSQGLLKFFRASIYRAHRAVIFAIAGLSCCYSPTALSMHYIAKLNVCLIGLIMATPMLYSVTFSSNITDGQRAIEKVSLPVDDVQRAAVWRWKKAAECWDVSLLTAIITNLSITQPNIF